MYQDHERQEKTKKLFRLKETKEHGGKIATCDSELDLFVLKDINGTIGET